MNSLLEKLGALDAKQRWMLCGMLILLIGGLGYYLRSVNSERLATLTAEVDEMKASVQKHRAIAARHEHLKAQLAGLEDALRVAITLLPETREIPELLTQISHLGMNAGLEFRLFKPEPEKKADFYAEVPVSLAILGKYHAVAAFFDQLSKLSRIVNVTDIKMTLTKGPDTEPILSTNCLLTTFRFLEPREADSKTRRKPPGQQKGS